MNRDYPQAVNTAREVGDLDRLAGIVSGCVQELNTVNEVAADLIGRIYGEGATTGKEQKTPHPAGALGSLLAQIEEMRQTISRTQALVSKLQGLA